MHLEGSGYSKNIRSMVNGRKMGGVAGAEEEAWIDLTLQRVPAHALQGTEVME